MTKILNRNNLKGGIIYLVHGFYGDQYSYSTWMDLEDSKKFAHLWVCPWGNFQKYLIRESKLVLNKDGTMPWPGVPNGTQGDNRKRKEKEKQTARHQHSCLFLDWLRVSPTPCYTSVLSHWMDVISLTLWVKTSSPPSSSPFQAFCNSNQESSHYHFGSSSSPSEENTEGQSVSWWQQRTQTVPHFLVDGKGQAQWEEARD